MVTHHTHTHTQARFDTLAIDQTTLKRLPKAVIRRLDALKMLHVCSPTCLARWHTPTQAHHPAPAPLQEDFKKLQAQKVEERKQMEAKYAALFAPLFTQRAEIVANRLDPADVDTTQQEGANNKWCLVSSAAPQWLELTRSVLLCDAPIGGSLNRGG